VRLDFVRTGPSRMHLCLAFLFALAGLLLLVICHIGCLLSVLLSVPAFSVDISSQLKAARQQAEVSRQELTEYKEKAARILQVQYNDQLLLI